MKCYLKLTTTFSATLVLFLATGVAHATIVAYRPIQTGVGFDGHIATAGTLVEAFNLGTATGETRNTVTFAGDTGTDGVAGNAAISVISGPGTLGSITLSAIDPLFYSFTYATSGSATGMQFNYTGLNPVRTYLVQVLDGEPRDTFSSVNNSNTFTDANGTVAVPGYRIGNQVANQNPSASADRVIQAATISGVSNFTFATPNGTASESGTVARGSSLAGFQVRDVTGVAPPMISFSPVQNGTTAPILDNTFGQLEIALNLGNGGALVRDGISFTNVNATSTVNDATNSGDSINYGTYNGIEITAAGRANVTASTFNQFPVAPSDALFGTESYSTGSNYTLFLTGLDPLRSYQIQLLHGDTRDGAFYNNGTTSATAYYLGLPTLVQSNLTFGKNGADLTKQFAIETLTLSGADSMSFYWPGAGRGASLSGIVVFTAVPEPGSLVTLFCGIAVLCPWLRKRTR